MTRLDQITLDIEAAEDRYYRHLTASTPRQGQHIGAVEQKANETVMAGLQASIDLMKAKLVNVRAGLPEDHGIAPPANFETLVDGRIQRALNAAMSAVGQVLAEKLKPMEKRLAGVEAGGLRYRGVYQRAQADEYRKGDCVTSGGSLWVAIVDSPEGVPGDGTSGWQLAVKGVERERSRDRGVLA